MFLKKFKTAEDKIYLGLWIASVFYSLYQFTQATSRFFYRYKDSYNDFQSGWQVFPSHKQDRADFEWNTICYFVKNIFPYLLAHLLLSEGIRHVTESIKVRSCLYIGWTLNYLLLLRGPIFVLLILLQPALFLLIAKLFRNRTSIWICSFVSIFLITYLKHILAEESLLRFFKIGHMDVYFMILSTFWMNLKCIYYFLNNFSTTSDLRLFFSYCLYFPTFFTGPFLTYEDFTKTFTTKEYKQMKDRVINLGTNLTRCFFWMIFTEAALHFVFVNATGFQPELVSKFNTWQLCGYGYAMGQFFHLKYVVLYGLTTSLATFENIPVPALPRCIGRVHLYSDMWKFFDPGLYKFLKRCIYIPSRQHNINKFVASFLCFVFVYLWHGTELYVLIWATLNFVGVCLESMAKSLYENYLKKIGFVKNLPRDTIRRLTSAFASPLLVMSAVSNFYFFAGYEIGNIFAQKILNDALPYKAVLLFALFCCCEVSRELRNVNAHQM